MCRDNLPLLIVGLRMANIVAEVAVWIERRMGLRMLGIYRMLCVYWRCKVAILLQLISICRAP